MKLSLASRIHCNISLPYPRFHQIHSSPAPPPAPPPPIPIPIPNFKTARPRQQLFLQPRNSNNSTFSTNQRDFHFRTDRGDREMKLSLASRVHCNISLPYPRFHQIHSSPAPPSPIPIPIPIPIPNFKTARPYQQLFLLPRNSNNSIFSINKRDFHFRTICAFSSSGGERNSPKVEPPSKALRRILDSPGVHQGPACFDALSAKLVERAGFQYCFTSGFSISAARLGLPDTGLISYGEMVDQGRQITEAVSIPVIGDGDNGYGNAINVKRTVKGYIRAGFAGIIIEDQVSPKACGHTRGRKVVSREEAVMRIKVALDARKESGSDIVIVARTDSRQAVSLDESLWRSRAFADAGADVLFIDALASKEEMKAFCEVYPLVPKMANMLEGGGKTPLLNPIELGDVGYKLVVYPLSLIGASVRAMQDALTAIKGGRIPPPGSMPSFEEMKEIFGFNTYYEEEKRYATSTSKLSSQRGYFSASSNAYGIQRRAQDDTEQRARNPQDPIVEVITPEVYDSPGAYGSRDPFSGIWSRTLRIKITGRDGIDKLDVRIPAGFLEGITNLVPALGGVNIKELLDDAAEEVGGKQLLDFNDTMGDRIQVFLE